MHSLSENKSSNARTLCLKREPKLNMHIISQEPAVLPSSFMVCVSLHGGNRTRHVSFATINLGTVCQGTICLYMQILSNNDIPSMYIVHRESNPTCRIYKARTLPTELHDHIFVIHINIIKGRVTQLFFHSEFVLCHF